MSSFLNVISRVRPVCTLVSFRNKATKQIKMPHQTVLCVAEKNDAAKNIAALLSNRRSTYKNTRSPYNKLYIFDDKFQRSDATFVFTSVSGHLTELEFEPVCRNWDTYPIHALFTSRIHRTVPPGMKNIESTLR